MAPPRPSSPGLHWCSLKISDFNMLARILWTRPCTQQPRREKPLHHVLRGTGVIPGTQAFHVHAYVSRGTSAARRGDRIPERMFFQRSQSSRKHNSLCELVEMAITPRKPQLVRSKHRDTRRVTNVSSHAVRIFTKVETCWAPERGR